MIGKVLLYAIIFITSVVFFTESWIATGTPNISLFRWVSTAALACSVIFFIWNQWVWKLRVFQMLPGVPRDISGTWETTLESLWVNPATNKVLPPKTVYIVIRQTSANATITLISNESKSKSSIARIIKENDDWLIHYVYSNEPQMDLRDRSPIHHGSGVLAIVGSPVKRIAGSYWTDRDSKGKLSLNRRVKRYAEDFEGGEELFK